MLTNIYIYLLLNLAHLQAQPPLYADSDEVSFFIDASSPVRTRDTLPMMEVSVPKKTTAQKVSFLGQGATRGQEFRAIWVSTVQRVDFPSQATTHPESLKQEWLNLLSFYKSLNINAVIVQVRPAADAIYPSRLVPFSKFISGKSGKGLDQNFDLLDFMIKTSKKAGMEFHAWMNPFRAVVDGDTANLAANHPFKAHRDWIYKYGKEYQLNPGIPEVREHLIDVVEELARNYDIDAIHFDDYYYPYRILNEEINDSSTFLKYGKDFKNIKDWRRNNINLTIETVYKRVKAVRSSIQVGVSPFAVWRNKETDKLGSDTKGGQQCYDDLYADVLKWIKSDWVDYVAPEIYFHLGHPQVDFRNALLWWVRNSYGKKLYIGLALYKIQNTKYRDWDEPDQIPRQIELLRQFPEIKGLMLFSSKQLLENRLGVTDILREQYFNDGKPIQFSSKAAKPVLKQRLPTVKQNPVEPLGASKKKPRH